MPVAVCARISRDDPVSGLELRDLVAKRAPRSFAAAAGLPAAHLITCRRMLCTRLDPVAEPGKIVAAA